MGKFWRERCVCAPQREAGGMESVPKVSDSSRVGREAISGDFSWMVPMAPGVKVEGAKICFIADAV